jgi:hypothetical protein
MLVKMINCGMAKAIIMCMHTQQETGGTAAQQRYALSIESSTYKGKRKKLPIATGGGVLAAATGSHVTSPGRRATAYLRLPLHNCGAMVPT